MRTVSANARMRDRTNINTLTAWHASSGLAMQILERQSEIEKTIPSLEPTRKTCKGWDTWLAKNIKTFDQDDSGI